MRASTGWAGSTVVRERSEKGVLEESLGAWHGTLKRVAV